MLERLLPGPQHSTATYGRGKSPSDQYSHNPQGPNRSASSSTSYTKPLNTWSASAREPYKRHQGALVSLAHISYKRTNSSASQKSMSTSSPSRLQPNSAWLSPYAGSSPLRRDQNLSASAASVGSQRKLLRPEDEARAGSGSMIRFGCTSDEASPSPRISGQQFSGGGKPATRTAGSAVGLRAWPAASVRFEGMRNLGNTCYMNAVLQVRQGLMSIDCVVHECQCSYLLTFHCYFSFFLFLSLSFSFSLSL